FYTIEGKYDPINKLISPPDKNQMLPIVDWDRAHNIFNHSLDMVPKIYEHYVVYEIFSFYSLYIFDSIFMNLDLFESCSYIYGLKLNKISKGKQCALVKQWINKDARLQLWIAGEGIISSTNDQSYAIMYGNSTDFIIVGNNNGHSFVVNRFFEFSN